MLYRRSLKECVLLLCISSLSCSLFAQAGAAGGTSAQSPGGPRSPEQIAAARKAQDELQLHDFPNLAKYREANAALPPPATGETRVVFMGDSITEFWGRKRTPPSPDAVEFFPGLPYINRGISGQTSPQMLVRFRQDVVDLKPKVVVILAGTNDIAENTGPMEMTDTEENLQSMVDIAKANKIAVVLCSITPSADFWWHKGLEPSAKIQALNSWIKKFAMENHYPYVDYYSSLVDADGAFNASYSADGVHPNGKGYQVMAPLAQKGIDEALQSRK
jgi:lysophospholipase L1-like esterase